MADSITEIEKKKKTVDTLTLIISGLIGVAGIGVLVAALTMKIKKKSNASQLTIYGLLLLLVATIAAWIFHAISMTYDKQLTTYQQTPPA